MLPAPRSSRDHVAASFDGSSDFGTGCDSAVVALYQRLQYSNVSVTATVEVRDQNGFATALFASLVDTLLVFESRIAFTTINCTQQTVYGVAPFAGEAKLTISASNVTYEQADAASSAKAVYGMYTSMVTDIDLYNTTLKIITQLQQSYFYGVAPIITNTLNLTNSELYMQNFMNASDIYLYGIA